MIIEKSFLTDAKCEVPNRLTVQEKKEIPIKPVEVDIEDPSIQIKTKITTSPTPKPDICQCIIQNGENKGKVCGGKLVQGTDRCYRHQKKCITTAAIEKKKEPVIIQEQKIGEDQCPCIIQTGQNKGKPCLQKIFEDGKCKRHINKKCILPTVPTKEKEKEEVIVEKCPCIIQSGTRKGEFCMGKIFKDGKCSKHQRTCVKVSVESKVKPIVKEEEQKIPIEEIITETVDEWNIEIVDPSRVEKILQENTKVQLELDDINIVLDKIDILLQTYGK